MAVAAEAPGELCLLDVEASLEHFCQNKALNADTMLVVVEPYFKSLETGRRMIGLARQLAPAHLALVANKVRDEQGREAVERLAASAGVEVAGVVPHDIRMLEADLAGSALLDFDRGLPRWWPSTGWRISCSGPPGLRLHSGFRPPEWSRLGSLLVRLLTCNLSRVRAAVNGAVLLLLDRVADALLERETLTASELERVTTGGVADLARSPAPAPSSQPAS